MNKLYDKERQYSKFLNYKKNKEQKNKKIVVFIIFLILFVIAVSVFSYFTNIDFKNNVENKQESKQVISTKREQKKNSFRLFRKKQNILLLGVDAVEKGQNPFVGNRSDTIIILNIEPSSKTIYAVSIPRDSKVYLAQDKGVQKINAAHAIGGVKLTEQTIEETLGISIDKYVVVNLGAIKKMVDALGGIPIFVEKDMVYHDYAGKLHVNLKKGLNILDGNKAEGYLRYRHDALGDISRASRQQYFLKALLKKLQSPDALAKIPELLNIASSNVSTNLTLYEMSHLVALLRNINMSQIEFATLPGAPSKRGYLSYWILNPEKTQEVLDRMIYRIEPKVTEKPSTAGIVYVRSQEKFALEIKQELQEAGYSVNCLGRALLPHSQIIGHNEKVSIDFVKWLKKRVSHLKNSQFVYDPIKIYCVDSDFTIVLAES